MGEYYTVPSPRLIKTGWDSLNLKTNVICTMQDFLKQVKMDFCFANENKSLQLLAYPHSGVHCKKYQLVWSEKSIYD